MLATPVSKNVRQIRQVRQMTQHRETEFAILFIRLRSLSYLSHLLALTL